LDERRSDIARKVDGMRGEGCAEAARRTIRALDPEAEVQVDRDRGQVSAKRPAPTTLEVTAALTKAGYNATGMTG